MALAGGAVRAILIAVALCPTFSAARAQSAASPITIVAAENFYGDIAARIGGDAVKVTSILSSPDQDPHFFEATPSAARRIAGARLVIENGAGYDPWMDTLLAASPRADRIVLNAATLLQRKPGDNPHLWYEPAAMPAVAMAIAEALAQIDPAHRDDYERRLATFRTGFQAVAARVVELRQKYARTVVTATEPIFGDMAMALGFTMRNFGFQRAMMNDTEPSASDIAGFERDLDQHAVRLVIYNIQTATPLSRRLVALAQAKRIPTIGVSETEPAGKTYEQWMLGQLDAIAQALAGETP